MRGHIRVQTTRPQTIGYALADSPVGQAAWICNIFQDGTDNNGNPESALTRDEMLDEITLYWLTDTAASSARLYFENGFRLRRHDDWDGRQYDLLETIRSGISQQQITERKRYAKDHPMLVVQ